MGLEVINTIYLIEVSTVRNNISSGKHTDQTSYVYKEIFIQYKINYNFSIWSNLGNID